MPLALQAVSAHNPTALAPGIHFTAFIIIIMI
jgi:hypothetical protein